MQAGRPLPPPNENAEARAGRIPSIWQALPATVQASLLFLCSAVTPS